MARSTKASNAVNRLRERSNNAPYSMVSLADGRFSLTLANLDNPDEHPQAIGEALEIDDFVAYVNSLHKQAPKKASKLDIAFEKKLAAAKQK
ncbi:hypothetical protein [Undibacterium sp. TS12]|uniref:hypothetical protein n=1 Tax=Undibacterium sp. TS12 TaxID=2908202 RepID=UPI001F4CE969|nr:hypothetical protein [Undibacterium sp. TS12]MCH8621535.1 hypothetical protein [Undibacterium sp. TS12]